jgi:mannose-6-phosphate isomerase
VAYLLDNPVQTYAWGSPSVIPDLLGVPPTGEPQAELWVGAHPSAPSRVEVEGTTRDLTELIAGDPEAMLGVEAATRFGPRLPYLLKILAIDRPLSIQAHPTIPQAEAGFAAEDAADIPLSAPQRLYRDRSHKPEMIVALTDVEALVGFRAPEATADLLDSFDVGELSAAARQLREDGARAVSTLVRRWLRMPAAEVAGLVGVVVEAAKRAADEPARLVHWLNEEYPGDRGLLVALLLQHLRLEPGEAVFIPAGMPHAYLRGVAVEPQASSDNTLRAGLTPKHVDAEALMGILSIDAGADPRVSPTGASGQVAVYAPPVEEFELARVELDGHPVSLPGRGPRTVLVTEGAVRVSGERGRAVDVRQGRAAFVPDADGDLTLDELAGGGTVFAVAVPSRTAG